MPSITDTIFAILFMFVVVQRLWELSLSRRNRVALAQRGFELSEPASAYQHMVVMHVLFFFGMLLESYYLGTQLDPAIRLLAIAFFITAQAFRFWTLSSLGSHWNTSVMKPGQGATGDLFCTAGPYQYLRHPNYLVVIIEILTLPLIGNAVLTSILFSLWNGVILVDRIILEEKFLCARPGYLQAFDGIPRFFPNNVSIQRLKASFAKAK